MNSRRIDTHAHVVPPRYREWLLDKGQTAGGLAIPEWSVDKALEAMSVNEVETSVLSVSTPGVEPADSVQEARSMAREVNEFCADLVRTHPTRFGLFATLPEIRDVEGALAEAHYALEVLGADGVVLLANSRGTYLGDSSYEPLFEYLNSQSAVVFVHPSSLPAEPVPDIPAYGLDFLLDTSRAALNMSRRGWLDKYPNCRIILSHGGGFLPYASMRVARLSTGSGDNEEGIQSLQRFWFDTALSSSPYALPSLLSFANPQRVLFGSDWPYANLDRGHFFTGMLDDYEEIDHAAVNRRNAEQLFPRLQSQQATDTEAASIRG